MISHQLKQNLKDRLGLSRLPTDQEINLLLKRINEGESFYSLCSKAETIFSECWTGIILEQKSITDDVIVKLQTLKRELGL